MPHLPERETLYLIQNRGSHTEQQERDFQHLYAQMDKPIIQIKEILEDLSSHFHFHFRFGIEETFQPL